MNEGTDIQTTTDSPTGWLPRLVRPWLTKCCVCGRKYENGCGSTECCGSIQEVIAYGVTLKRAVKGQYAAFDVGEEVWVGGHNNGVCTIERREWKGSKVTLANVLASVPVDYISWPNT